MELRLKNSPPGAPVLFGESLLPHKEDSLTINEMAAVCKVSWWTIRREITRKNLKAKPLTESKNNQSIRITRTSALIYLVKKGLATPEQAYAEVAEIINDWPLFMKRDLLNQITKELS